MAYPASGLLMVCSETWFVLWPTRCDTTKVILKSMIQKRYLTPCGSRYCCGTKHKFVGFVWNLGLIAAKMQPKVDNTPQFCLNDLESFLNFGCKWWHSPNVLIFQNIVFVFFCVLYYISIKYELSSSIVLCFSTIQELMLNIT